jgi:hypothetical protein
LAPLVPLQTLVTLQTQPPLETLVPLQTLAPLATLVPPQTLVGPAAGAGADARQGGEDASHVVEQSSTTGYIAGFGLLLTASFAILVVHLRSITRLDTSAPEIESSDSSEPS